jgi:hypothetical protein
MSNILKYDTLHHHIFRTIKFVLPIPMCMGEIRLVKSFLKKSIKK